MNMLLHTYAKENVCELHIGYNALNENKLLQDII